MVQNQILPNQLHPCLVLPNQMLIKKISHQMFISQPSAQVITALMMGTQTNSSVPAVNALLTTPALVSPLTRFIISSTQKIIENLCANHAPQLPNTSRVSNQSSCLKSSRERSKSLSKKSKIGKLSWMPYLIQTVYCRVGSRSLHKKTTKLAKT